MMIYKSKRMLATLLLWTAFSVGAMAQTFVVKNNLLYDGAQTPNLGFELKLSDHWTTALSGGYRPWPTDDWKEKKWRHLLVVILCLYNGEPGFYILHHSRHFRCHVACRLLYQG